ncbi:DUF2274 domain-containing protein [Bradyrhizobium sp. Gha]|uniref:DUF2274 domain-containing protein n=1 Tax=Bradyrhizobium sp. Gha TaxID=1855318 RepID=UPI0008E805F6|nr:DUF2274 domain-containing protein [Bradyrhizobium sp. Gha]SFJ93228.1 hypothetical protein SAMN05216525_14332 [Bradyrhizobium sp. Gha]
MPKLKLGKLTDDKPIKVTVELPAAVHRDLILYAEALTRAGGQLIDPTKLIAPMLARFMASDRVFSKLKREGHIPTADEG